MSDVAVMVRGLTRVGFGWRWEEMGSMVWKKERQREGLCFVDLPLLREKDEREEEEGA